MRAAAVSLVTYQKRLLSEAAQLGADAILGWLPAEYSPELEQAVRQGVRQAVLHDIDGLDGELKAGNGEE